MLFSKLVAFKAGASIFYYKITLQPENFQYIAPTENNDPTTNGRTYRLYCAFSFLSQTLGILYFSTLFYGLYRLVRFAFNPAARSKLRSLPGLLQVSDDFISTIKYKNRGWTKCRASCKITSRDPERSVLQPGSIVKLFLEDHLG